MIKASVVVLGFTALIFSAGCTPEVGSEAWCKMMMEKPKGDWTASEAADYGKHCLFK